MRFYNQRHQFYCGIDLHANFMHVCVVDHEGERATTGSDEGTPSDTLFTQKRTKQQR